MERSKEMQNFVDGFAEETFGRSLTEAQEKVICTFCGKQATDFRDSLSRKEYAISGICQECQDELFGK